MNKLAALLTTIIFASAVNVSAYAADAAPAAEKAATPSSSMKKATHDKDAKHQNKKHGNEHKYSHKDSLKDSKMKG